MRKMAKMLNKKYIYIGLERGKNVLKLVEFNDGRRRGVWDSGWG